MAAKYKYAEPRVLVRKSEIDRLRSVENQYTLLRGQVVNFIMCLVMHTSTKDNG